MDRSVRGPSGGAAARSIAASSARFPSGNCLATIMHNWRVARQRTVLTSPTLNQHRNPRGPGVRGPSLSVFWCFVPVMGEATHPVLINKFEYPEAMASGSQISDYDRAALRAADEDGRFDRCGNALA